MDEAIEEIVVKPQKPLKPPRLVDKNLTGEIFRLALPAIGENLLLALMMIVDLVMVGNYTGSAGLSSVGFGVSMTFVVTILLLPLPIATNAVVARFVGAGQMERARRACGQSILVCFAVGTALSVVLYFFTGGILWGMGIRGKVFDLGELYLKWMFASFVFRLMFLNAGAAMKGAGNTVTPMIVGGIANVVNIVLDYGLIFGRLGMPELGVEGAAIATAISVAVGGVVLVAMLFAEYSAVNMSWRHLKGWSWRIFRSLWRVALPSMAEQTLFQVGFIAYLRVVTELGDKALAAHFIGIRVESFSFLPGLGFGIAAATLVGQSLGARQPAFAARSMKRCALYGCMLMGLMGVLIYFCRYEVPKIFQADAEVLELTAQCLWIAAISQIPLALALILAGALRGAGDTLSAMMVALAGIVLVRVPLAYFMGLKWGMGLVGIWWASVADLVVRSVLVILLLWWGRWRRLKV